MIGEGTRAGARPETVFDTVFTQFLRAVDKLHHFIALAYQESKSLNAVARKELIVREKRVQGLLGEVIRYGAERGRFAPDNIDLKAHNIMVLGHAWAIRHWMFAGVIDSVDDYSEFLRPLVYSMLETNVANGLLKTDRTKTSIEEGPAAAPKQAQAGKPMHAQSSG